MTDAPCPKCGDGRLHPDPAAPEGGAMVLKCAACGHEQHAEVPGIPPWAPDSPESRARERKLLAAAVLGGAVAVAIVLLFLG